ncbi:MAG TPA: VCBS repeat-containing protein, partial [Bacteroidetes bacterium]|nr:VCBS repeat-containing protein [Bacteroidota bacterium]HEX03694.1 VCBS repeat-containing protein [Bacteroidota bacterium]
MRFWIAVLLMSIFSSISMAQNDWVKHIVATGFDHAHGVFAADVDGDGDIDALGAAKTGSISWWENTDGNGLAWQAHPVVDGFAGAENVHAADVDGDGDMDILGAARDDDDITWWENSAGDGSIWIEHIIDGGFTGAFTVRGMDVDLDGDIDVLGAADIANDITWWENTQGNGTTWIEHTVDGSFDGANSVYAADVDGDGDMDILGAAHDADQITWWENLNGSGTSWSEHLVGANFDWAFDVYAQDFDADGDIDILGSARNSDEVAWWENV